MNKIEKHQRDRQTIVMNDERRRLNNDQSKIKVLWMSLEIRSLFVEIWFRSWVTKNNLDGFIFADVWWNSQLVVELDSWANVCFATFSNEWTIRHAIFFFFFLLLLIFSSVNINERKIFLVIIDLVMKSSWSSNVSLINKNKENEKKNSLTFFC